MKAPARAAGRLTLAAVAALALWLAFVADVWGGAVVFAAQAAIRMVEQPRATHLTYEKSEVVIRRADMGADSDVPAFDVAAFTAPVVLLLTLLWGGGRLVPRRGAWRGFSALGILFAAQTLHLVLAIQTLYATQLGEWSTAKYPRWERELFASGRSIFDLGLAWGLPVALWVAFYGLPAFRAAEAAGPRKRKTKG